MASTDALIAPVKAAAFRMPVGPFFKTDGTIITGWTSADSEISKDGGNFADCTDEATEIQTSGTGFLDLSTSETNCDSFWIRITISNTDAVPFVAYFATQRSGAYLLTTVAANNDKTGYSISGTTTTFDALQTALNSAHGAGSWATATGFSTHSAADIWAVTTRLLTAGTNIVLAKGTGITGFTDLDASGVRGALGLGSANLDTQLAAISSKTTNLPSDPADASDIASAFGTVNSTLGTIAGYLDTEVAAIKAKTDLLNSDVATAATRLLTLIELVTGSTYRFTTGALFNAPAGEGGGGGGGLTEEEAAQLNTIYLRTSGGEVVFVSPLSVTGTVLRVNRGDDYFATEGRALDFSSDDWPVLTDGSVVLRVGSKSFDGTVTAARSVRVELTHTQTDTLEVKLPQFFEVEATLANGRVITLVRGNAVVTTNPS